MALKHLQKAVELHPDFFQALNNMGAIYLKQNRPQGAKRPLISAYQINPNSPLILRNLGLTYLLLGESDQAVRILSRATALKSDDARSHAFLGLALIIREDTRKQSVP